MSQPRNPKIAHSRPVIIPYHTYSTHTYTHVHAAAELPCNLYQDIPDEDGLVVIIYDSIVKSDTPESRCTEEESLACLMGE